MSKFISILFCALFLATIVLQVFGLPEPNSLGAVKKPNGIGAPKNIQQASQQEFERLGALGQEQHEPQQRRSLEFD